MADTLQQAQGSTKDYYNSHGYVVLRKLIPEEKVDRLVDLYKRQIVPSKAKFYRQNTNEYEANDLTSAGHVIQSFLDIHNYKKFPDFRKAALDIYFSDEILGALSRVTGHESHNLMQSMLFDANTTTPPHQDWWYLDSVPAGHLLGAWIALEDIQEAAGRFFVMPETQRIILHEEGMPHSNWLAIMKRYFDDHPSQVSAPALAKGDVVFWNSGTIHGSLPTKDLQYSRKSLTAHYMPSAFTFGNLFTSKPWIQYETYEVHKYYANQPEYSMRAELASKVKQALYDNPRLLALARKFQRSRL
jgi:phytanoyl-CoA hydroxylase